MSLLYGIATNLNHTILYRVRELLLGNQTDDIESVVEGILNGCGNLTNSHRVETGCNV